MKNFQLGWLVTRNLLLKRYLAQKEDQLNNSKPCMTMSAFMEERNRNPFVFISKVCADVNNVWTNTFYNLDKYFLRFGQILNNVRSYGGKK